MRFKVAFTIAFCFGAIAAAQQRDTFPQPTAAKEVVVSAIPGVIAAGAKWKLVWRQSLSASITWNPDPPPFPKLFRLQLRFRRHCRFPR